MQANRLDAGRLLRSCLLADGEAAPEELLARVDRSEWAKLNASAKYHRVRPAVYLALRKSEHVPGDVLATFQLDYERAVRHHLLCCQLLTDVAGRFDRDGVRYVALKGPVLAEMVYPRPDTREYLDLDLLVDPAHFGAALEILESSGGELMEQNWELCLHLLKGELNVLTPHGVVVDLHWDLLYSEELRRRFSWRDLAVLDRARTVDLAGTPVSVPDPNDQLQHLCVHACLAGCHRVGWLEDIRRAATRTDITWPVFWSRAKESDTALVCAAALDHVNRCFALALPVPVPRSAWRGLLRVLDGVRPPDHWRGSQFSGHVISAATSSDAATSFTALGTGIRRALGEFVHQPGHPWRPAWSRRRPAVAYNPMTIASGGRSGRAAFLRAVEASTVDLGTGGSHLGGTGPLHIGADR